MGIPIFPEKKTIQVPTENIPKLPTKPFQKVVNTDLVKSRKNGDNDERSQVNMPRMELRTRSTNIKAFLLLFQRPKVAKLLQLKGYMIVFWDWRHFHQHTNTILAKLIFLMIL